MSRRVSREEFANMERMLIEYKQGYEAIYTICYNLSIKLDQLDKQITELISANPDKSIGLGDK